MRKNLLILIIAAVAFAGFLLILAPHFLPVLVIVAGLSAVFLSIFRRFSTEPDFVTLIFVGGLAVRLAFGFIVYAFDGIQFFGGDALTYDFRGATIAAYWEGLLPAGSPDVKIALSTFNPGWGMNYLVGSIYFLFGKNFLAAQSLVAVFGAATGPLVYFCADKIFQNRRVAKYSAVALAFFPSFIIWSSQLMKDGLIVFLLVLAITMVLRLQEKFSYVDILLLVLSLGGIISLRFYIFYMVAVAVAGSFVIGITNTVSSVARRAAVLIIIGMALTYLGVIRTATVDFERYGDLEQLQRSRLDQTRGESSFAEEIDVSTTEGALSAIPIGFVYLMFAPFPWQISNLRQAITLPEVLLWWSMMPFLVWGFWYTLKNRLRKAFPIVIFSIMLTLAYSIFQSNVGTAYRQRTQIQVFLFMFISVGWVLYRERVEDKKMIQAAKNRRFDRGVRAGV